MALIDPELLSILACPRCRAAVRPVDSERSLLCAECGAAYLVNDAGVPIMTVDDD
ncbi:MAG: Trm112 family protein [Acidimicrobiia bacterium]|nr:Trm112 family protein [bacterium]MXX00380.1 Trm112 family protein [Acidimicrobiia bacterium]MDE0674415.1 Trm112 family protein [bacterium]MXX44964.1 Trm112 family protein [Acidimicrobiia bacterium]MXY73454.1 Trm112 family protein [Acidimicrobiia bacterium]